jgi:Holliday junction resolvasome RuvABC DNA-binding subunit
MADIGDILKTSEELAEEGTQKFMKFSKGIKSAGIIAAALLATAAIVDVGNDMHDAKKARIEEAEQNKRLRRQEGRDERAYENLGYDYETYQEVLSNANKGKRIKHDPVIEMLSHDGLVQDMFNNRSNHTKMGNSRFY